MKVKKFAVLLIAVAMIFSMTACSKMRQRRGRP